MLINPNGSKWWRFDYSFQGKRKTLSLGTYPTTTLANAREQRLEAKQNLKTGIDPSSLRKEAKQQVQDKAEQQKRLDDGLLAIGSSGA